MELVRITARQAREPAVEWTAYASALAARDPRLVVLPELTEYFESQILRSVDEGGLALALRDSAGWRIIAQGIVWNLRKDDPAQEIVFRTSLVWNVAWLRPTDSCDARELFDAMDEAARARRVEATYVCFHACDAETAALVARHGFDPAYAHCVRTKPLGDLPAPPMGVEIRIAKPGDGQRVVDCHLEELRYHAECAPSQRTDYPNVRERQLKGCEEVIRDVNGVSLYAEEDGEVIAVADGRVGYAMLRPSLLLPEARMGFLRSVGTTAKHRGRGVGRALCLALAAELAKKGAQRWELVYCPWNPLSSRFWPRMGWIPASFGFVKKTRR